VGLCKGAEQKRFLLGLLLRVGNAPARHSHDQVIAAAAYVPLFRA
jgi:hypothetical protein